MGSWWYQDCILQSNSFCTKEDIRKINDHKGNDFSEVENVLKRGYKPRFKM